MALVIFLAIYFLDIGIMLPILEQKIRKKSLQNIYQETPK